MAKTMTIMRSNKLHPGGDREALVKGLHDLRESTALIEVGHEYAEEGSHQDADEGGDLADQEHHHQNQRKQRYPADLENPVQGRSIGIEGRFVEHSGPDMAKTQEGEEDQRQDVGGDRGPQAASDVLEEVRVGHARGKVRAVGEGGQLIAEERSADDGAGDHPGGEAHGDADAHHRESPGPRRSVGGPRGQGHDGADEHRYRQEVAGVDQLQPVTDDRWNRPGDDPGSDEGPHREQNQDDDKGGTDGV